MTGNKILGLLVLSVVLLAAPAYSFWQASESFECENRDNRFWVHRRDKDEPDPKGARAVVIKIDDSDLVNKTVSVKIWKYLGYADGAYTRADGGAPPPMLLATGCVEKASSANSRKLETIRIMVGADVIGYATLYRGKNPAGKGKGNAGRSQQRLVFRWKPTAAKAVAQKSGEFGADPCDDPPDDDPMEEEPLGTDPPDPLPDPLPDPP